jgi:hypothetical protein
MRRSCSGLPLTANQMDELSEATASMDGVFGSDGISKRGNQYLRRLLINGASANLLRSKATNADPWVIGLHQQAGHMNASDLCAARQKNIGRAASRERET